MMEYVYRRSLIHELHPLTKLIWSVVLLTLALILDSPWYLAVLIVSLAVLMTAQAARSLPLMIVSR